MKHHFGIIAVRSSCGSRKHRRFQDTSFSALEIHHRSQRQVLRRFTEIHPRESHPFPPRVGEVMTMLPHGQLCVG